MYAEFEKLLKDKMGLDASSIGTSNVERAVRARMVASKTANIEAYLSLLRSSSTETQELIEAVVVPETWFFRDREAFRALGTIAGADWIGRRPGDALRLLSLPCSTGEEPYSMAMTLFDAGLSRTRFCIDAIDISARALAIAQNASYGKNSFRDKDLGFRDLYFTEADGKYHPSDLVRKTVRFTQANLFSGDFSARLGTYDVIFCRNVLIYFGKEEQIKAVAILKRMLINDGFLFVGPSETGLLLECGFESAKIPLAFAFHKAGDCARPNILDKAAPARPHPMLRQNSFNGIQVPQTNAKTTARSKGILSPRPVATHLTIEEIERLADAGQTTEAIGECRKHLRYGAPSMRIFYLMALLCDTAGNFSEAAEYYRKALYLEPLHHESLRHLALLLEKQGDKASARIFSDRLRRANQKGEQV